MKINSFLKIAAVASSVLWVSGAMANSDAVNSQNLRIADYTDTTTTTEQPSDTSITTSVKTKFLNEKLFGDADISAFSIRVETTNGIVHLTGMADNQAQIDNAIKLSESVKGVRKVVSDVKLKNTSGMQ